MKYILLFLGIVSVSLLGVSASFAEGETDVLIAADFDSASATNNLGGEVEVWLAGDGSDTTQTSKMNFVEDDALENEAGHSLKIDYDVESDNPAYNGVRTNLINFDASGYKTLNFYIRGDAETGFPKTLKIEIIGENGKPSPHMFTGITDEWQKITIPLSDFVLIKDWTKLQKFVVVFADIESNPKVGTIYLDHIHFSKN